MNWEASPSGRWPLAQPDVNCHARVGSPTTKYKTEKNKKKKKHEGCERDRRTLAKKKKNWLTDGIDVAPVGLNLWVLQGISVHLAGAR